MLRIITVFRLGVHTTWCVAVKLSLLGAIDVYEAPDSHRLLQLPWQRAGACQLQLPPLSRFIVASKVNSVK